MSNKILSRDKWAGLCIHWELIGFGNVPKNVYTGYYLYRLCRLFSGAGVRGLTVHRSHSLVRTVPSVLGSQFEFGTTGKRN